MAKKSKTNLTAGKKACCYLFSVLKVGLTILVVRVATLALFAYLFNLSWNVEYYAGFLPYIVFADYNILSYELTNLLSLMSVAIVLFVLFFMVQDRVPKDQEECDKLCIFWNVLYFGLFVDLVGFLVVLAQAKNVNQLTNWLGLVPIFVLLLVATSSYINKRTELITTEAVSKKTATTRKKSVKSTKKITAKSSAKTKKTSKTKKKSK